MVEVADRFDALLKVLDVRLDAADVRISAARRDRVQSKAEIIRQEREQMLQRGRGGRGAPTREMIIRQERLQALLNSRGGKGPPSKEEVIKQEREETLRKGKGRRGKRCGDGWIRPDYNCQQATIDSLEARLDAARRRMEAPGQLGLDFTGGGGRGPGPGGGEPCGNSWISPDYTCHKEGGPDAAEKPPSRFMQLARATQERKAREAAERQQQQAAAAARASRGPTFGLPDQADEKTPPLLDGKPPRKSLGGGAYGDTYLYELEDGRQMVVKVDRLQNLDPMETGYGKDQEEQRWDMVHREREAMAKAHQLGLAPKPIGAVQKLSDGRLAFGYEFVDGVKIWKDHREAKLTPEAFELLEQPGMRAKVAQEVGRIARTMADSGFEHGDAHGGNVILGRNGSVTLIDWGYSNQSDSSTPRAKAGIEMRTVSILGEQLGVIGPIDMRAGRGGVKERPRDAIIHFERLMSDARLAGEKVIRNYERKWDAKPENYLDDPGKALLQANRLVKERGISFREAEGIVGLEAPLTPAIKAKARAAEDAVFGDRQLQLVRRMLDAHYRAWKDYAPAEAA